MNIKKIKENGHYIKDLFGRFRYEIRISKGATEIRRRIWAENDTEAARQAAVISKQTDCIRLRWSEGLKLWAEAHLGHCSPGYFDDIELHVRRFIEEFGDISIEETTHQKMLAYLNRRAQGNGATANRVRRILFVARWLRRNDMIRSIPFEHIPMFRNKPIQRKPILPDELPQYLAVLNDYSRPIVKMLAFTGLRSSAVCNLRESDIRDGAFVVREKMGKTRVIPIDSVLGAVLDEARAVKAKKGSQNEYVFIHQRGSKWDCRSLRHHCARKWKEAGLEHRPIHSLRHGFATAAALQGFSTRQLQAALDHEKFSTTERYLHDLKKSLVADEVGQAVRAELLKHLSNGRKNREKKDKAAGDEEEEPP